MPFFPRPMAHPVKVSCGTQRSARGKSSISLSRNSSWGTPSAPLREVSPSRLNAPLVWGKPWTATHYGGWGRSFRPPTHRNRTPPKILPLNLRGWDGQFIVAAFATWSFVAPTLTSLLFSFYLHHLLSHISNASQLVSLLAFLLLNIFPSVSGANGTIFVPRVRFQCNFSHHFASYEDFKLILHFSLIFLLISIFVALLVP